MKKKPGLKVRAVCERVADAIRFRWRTPSTRCCLQGHAQMSVPVPSDRSSSHVRHLVFLAAVMIAMYLCMRTLRFTHHGLNVAFASLFLSVPLFGIRPALRLRRWPKILALVLLTPLLAISIPRLLMMATNDIPDAIGHVQLSRELGSLQQGQYSVHLAWEETAGGAVGPHGVSLEQRRSILPGLYIVKSVDYFEGASEGSLSWVGPNTVSLYIPLAGYDQDQKDLRRVYSLKPWLYF